ncbi:polyketide synthase, partial [Streptomyces sp. SID5914]
FGISGTNAHVIIEQAPAAAPSPAAAVPAPAADAVLPWPLSGATPQALRGQAEALLRRLDTLPHEDLATAGRTLATGRAALEHRAVVVGGTAEELASGLRALVDGSAGRGVVVGSVRTGKTAFLFTG